jgi:G3E family GTPase
MNRGDVPVPLTIVGGFLGAGKTSLVNHLLAGAGGRRLAVLVNDFGEINIDAKLIAYQSDRVFSLTNGCICCDFGDNIYQTVFRMLDVDPPLDGMVIETSGVADPAKLAILGRVGKFLRLNATVIVVDAAHIGSHARDPYLADTILRQIAAADLLVINKCDLGTAEEVASIEAWLRPIAPNAATLRTAGGVVPIEVVLGEGAPTSRRDKAEEPENSHDHHHPEHALHRAVFSSWSFTAERPFIAAKLRDAVRLLPPAIVRGKGIVWLDEAMEQQTIFHLVGRRLEITDGSSWGTASPRTEVVFIAARAHGDFAPIEALLREALRGNVSSKLSGYPRADLPFPRGGSPA